MQKDMLDLMDSNVLKANCNEIGDSRFCVIMDESRKKQMALVCFLNMVGLVREHFLDLIHVHDTYFV